jgi:GNAT superfamily N-acetyltransferase
MRILTFDELTPSLELDRALVHLSAFGGVFARPKVDLIRSRLGFFSEYVGVFAVDRGRLLGQVFVLRIPYRFRDGAGVVGGIAAVGTQPDRARAGIAGALLHEAHRRERESGIERTALWTNRSWGAHNLYEELGYRDVYSSPWVLHAPLPRGRRRSAPGVRAGRRGDLAAIDRLHTRLFADRFGYHRRPKGFSRTELLLGELDPAKHLLVARRQGRLQGYARFDPNPSRVLCGELVAQDSATKARLIAGIARVAGPRPFVFQHTWVNDPPSPLGRPGYVATRGGWYRMMGCDLRRSWSDTEAVQTFGSDDDSFVCLSGDRF